MTAAEPKRARTDNLNLIITPLMQITPAFQSCEISGLDSSFTTQPIRNAPKRDWLTRYLLPGLATVSLRSSTHVAGQTRQ